MVVSLISYLRLIANQYEAITKRFIKKCVLLKNMITTIYDYNNYITTIYDNNIKKYDSQHPTAFMCLFSQDFKKAEI